MQNYELMVIYKPILFEDIKKTTLSKIQAFVKSKKAELKEVDNIGKKMLAYPLKKFKEGYYVEYTLKMDASDANEFKRELQLIPDVLRFLLVKK